jgi:hypothetical protein
MSSTSSTSYSPNIHIKGDKNAFLSKRSIDKFKESIKNINENVNENVNERLEEIIKKYIKEGYNVNISRKENNIFFDIYQNSLNSSQSQQSKYSKHLELKIKELKQKRLSNDQIKYTKEKLINSSNNDNDKIKKVIEEYEKVKKLTRNPILNPLDLDIYKNREQYKHIIKELYESFGNNNPFGNYYKIFLESLE